jgi:hypothetical protein
MVMSMCGHFIVGDVVSSRKTPTVTAAMCLVSDSVLDPLCAEARRLNVPIVGTSWLEACKAERAMVDPRLPQFALPPLKGCIISSTGFSRRTTEIIGKRVKQLGGTFLEALSGECTHLVYASNDDERVGGEPGCERRRRYKFIAAQYLGIRTVPLRWLWSMKMDALKAAPLVFSVS